MQGKSRLIYEEIIHILQENNLFSAASGNSKGYFNGIETHSGKVEKNNLFACIKGFESDGHDFASAAIVNGAELLICEKKLPLEIPQIIVDNSRKATAVLAAAFFDDPTSKLKLIGITGTNGKTTTALILEHFFREHNFSTGLIGTLGFSINCVNHKTALTTPDIIELNRIFAEMVSQKVEYVIMEVSSHALFLDRVFGLHFDAAIFTNISHDHLDFHKNLQEYADTKKKLFLFTSQNSGRIFLNIDDYYGNQIFESLNCRKYSISFSKGDFLIEQIADEQDNFILTDPVNSEKYHTKLIGDFNLFNISAAISVFKSFVPNLDSMIIQKYLNTLPQIPGRLEKIKNTRNDGIFIDFAHTPAALKNVLQTLKKICNGRLIVVFGCGGDRDKKKRPKLLKYALEFADLSIITSDNPRSENPAEIIKDIIKDSNIFDPYWIQSDRKTAIETAIKLSTKADIVLIAGKGHEKFQEIKREKHPFDDKKVALEIIDKDFSDENDLFLPIDLLQIQILFQQEKTSDTGRNFFSISTDTRSLKENSLFFALKGENFDGHDFVDSFPENSNNRAVVKRNFISGCRGLIFVDDTLSAYGKLAKKYSSLFDVTKIAITGSVGKTTTKEFIYNIFSNFAATLKTSANENNLIGLPKTLFKLNSDHKYAILELGTNHFGEIKKLSAIADPQIGIITAAGDAHLEFLKDRNGVFSEKTELFKRDLQMKIFPGDDRRFSVFNGISFGFNPDNHFQIKEIRTIAERVTFKINDLKYEIATPFPNFVSNAAIAIALAKEMSLPESIIEAGLKKPLQINARAEIKKIGETILIIDCYNANPDSMKASLEFWQNYRRSKNHIAILGDMLEMGKESENIHRMIGEKLKKAGKIFSISVGNFSEYYNSEIHFSDIKKLIDSKIHLSFSENSVILFKASHSIKLEEFVNVVENYLIQKRR